MNLTQCRSFLSLLVVLAFTSACEPQLEDEHDLSGAPADDELAADEAALTGYSGYANRTITTPNKSSRYGAPIQYIVLHHMASTSFGGVLNSWQTGAKEGSANYAISNEGEIVGVVPESLRSWSLSSATWDAKSITFEIENEAAGGSWPVSSAAHEATAKVVADLVRRYGIPLDRNRVLGHREVYTRHGASYATACPGGLNMDWIVARAAQLLGQGGIPAPVGSFPSAPVAGGHHACLNLPDAATQARVQEGLRLKGRYFGPVDGELGANGFKGIQLTLRNVGYTGPVDGVIGPVGCRLIQVYGQRFGDYLGPVDGVLGTNSWRGLALGLERP